MIDGAKTPFCMMYGELILLLIKFKPQNKYDVETLISIIYMKPSFCDLISSLFLSPNPKSNKTETPLIKGAPRFCFSIELVPIVIDLFFEAKYLYWIKKMTVRLIFSRVII